MFTFSEFQKTQKLLADLFVPIEFDIAVSIDYQTPPEAHKKYITEKSNLEIFCEARVDLIFTISFI